VRESVLSPGVKSSRTGALVETIDPDARRPASRRARASARRSSERTRSSARTDRSAESGNRSPTGDSRPTWTAARCSFGKGARIPAEAQIRANAILYPPSPCHAATVSRVAAGETIGDFDAEGSPRPGGPTRHSGRVDVDGGVAYGSAGEIPKGCAASANPGGPMGTARAEPGRTRGDRHRVHPERVAGAPGLLDAHEAGGRVSPCVETRTQ